MFKSDLTFQEVETLAAEDPKGYRSHLKQLAFVGYAFLMAAGVILVALAALLVLAFTQWHYIIILKWMIIPFLALLALLKSLNVKFEPPTGVPLSRSDAPELWKMIDEIREKTNCPHVDHLLLSTEYNCMAAQLPRFGFTPPYKTYVVVGLPLMDSLSYEQFRWVLAHELGHISELDDGPLSAWIYHVQMTWAQISGNLSTKEGFGSGPILKFASWYFPLFASHSLVLRRQHEHAADAFAAKFAGEAHGIEGLLAIAVRERAVLADFWEEILLRAKDLPEPPRDAFSDLRQKMREPLSPDAALEALRLTGKQHDEMDSHPSLYERARALGVDDAETAEALAEKFAAIPPLERTAAEAIFGANLPKLEAKVAQMWADDSRALWHTLRTTLVQNHTDLARFQGDPLAMPVRDQLDYAGLLVGAKQIDAAIDFLRQAVALHDDGELRLRLGQALLEERRDPEGVQHLERAMEMKSWTTGIAWRLLYEYYKRKGDDAQAAVYEKKGEEFLRQTEAAILTLPEMTGNEKLYPPDIPPRLIERMRAELFATKTIGDAWLVSRAVPDILGDTLHYLIVKPNLAFAMNDDDLYRELPLLAEAPTCSQFTLLPYSLIPSGIVTQANEMPSAHIYNRADYEKEAREFGDELPAYEPPLEHKKPGFFKRHWKWFAVGVPVCAIALFFLAVGDINEDNVFIDNLKEHEAAFVSLTKMLDEDKQLESVGTTEWIYGKEINALVPLKTRLKELGVSEARYRKYESLCDEICAMRISRTPNHDAMLIEMDTRDAGEIRRGIMWYPEDNVPPGFREVLNTENVKPDPDTEVGIYKPIRPHWCVARLAAPTVPH